MARIPKKYDAHELARHVQNARRNFPDPVSFDGYEIGQVESILIGCTELHRDVPPADRRGIIWNALVEAAKSQVITGTVLRRALNDAESSYLRKPSRDLVIATRISLPIGQPRITGRFDGCAFTITSTLPRRFDQEPIRADLDRFSKINVTRHSVLRLRTRARTDAAAITTALAAFDLIRATWNLRMNVRLLSRETSPEPAPVNQIRVGPVYSLHLPSGRLASDQAWFELPHLQHSQAPVLRTPWAELRTMERWVRGRIDRSRYGDDLRSLLVRYVRALDLADYEAAFAKLWSVLEHLTASIGSDYDVLVRRASFLYEDYRYARMLLQHLRDVRNGLVHHDRMPHRMELYLFQLKVFVETALLFHLRSRIGFTSLSVAGEYLGLPPDPAVLRRRATLYQRAAQFRT